MENIGIVEAQTHLPSVCDRVAASGQSITVSRRGKPLVVISSALPSPKNDEGIFSAVQRWEKENPTSEEDDFPEVWKERSEMDEKSSLED